MSVVISSNYVIAPTSTNGGIINGNNPVIGWDNIIGVNGTVSTTTEDPDFPASNLNTNSTHLRWKGGVTESDEHITILNTGAMDLDYIAIARHNLGSEQIPVSVDHSQVVDSFTKILLHFNGTDGSTVITDSSPSPKTWTAAGNAQIDTAQSRFGGGSCLLDGTGDWVSTPDHSDFILGTNDFTIDCWFNCNKAGGVDADLAGQTGGAAANTSFFIDRSATNVMRLFVSDGAGFTVVNGTTQFTNASNPGWHHLAAVRVGNILRLFIDGIQEGGDVAFSASIPNVTGSPTVGRRGDSTNNPWVGWIDEFRLSIGIARWIANFNTPVTEAEWVELVEDVILPNDGPAIFRFPKLAYTSVRLRMQVDLEEPIVAVVYCGELLVLQRRIYVGHAPINYSVETRVANGMSESGDFLGRVVLGEATSTQLSLVNLTPDWMRTYLAPFLEFARSDPFFMAWRPEEYAYEVGYCWLTNDPKPVNQRSRGHMQVSLEMGGVT